MATTRNREIRLRSRPSGVPTPDNFELVEIDAPPCRQGQILVRNLWISVDPYMRGRMREGKSYVPPFELGRTIEGGCIGQVVESKHPGFTSGEHVHAMAGWRDYWVSDGEGVERIDVTLAPAQAYLGVMGMPGLTAYVGLLRIAAFQPGETVFVSAAAGAVGSIVCQIAKVHGGRVIGSAGSEAKVEWLRTEAGVDYAFNYKTVESLSAELRRAAPDGLDVYFDNVGDDHLDAALRNMKTFGRLAICGMISRYNAEHAPPGPPSIHLVIGKRLRLQGFLVHDHRDMRDAFLRDMSGWIRERRVKYRETVVEGLEHAPEALIGLFTGENLGKMLVKV